MGVTLSFMCILNTHLISKKPSRNYITICAALKGDLYESHNLHREKYPKVKHTKEVLIRSSPLQNLRT